MGKGALDWGSEAHGSALVARPRGRIDEATADDFLEQLTNAVEGDARTVIVDLHDIAYMSSRGLRALILAQRAAKDNGTAIVLARPNTLMREILAISRYDMIFRVTESVEEALGGG